MPSGLPRGKLRYAGYATRWSTVPFTRKGSNPVGDAIPAVRPFHAATTRVSAAGELVRRSSRAVRTPSGHPAASTQSDARPAPACRATRAYHALALSGPSPCATSSCDTSRRRSSEAASWAKGSCLALRPVLDRLYAICVCFEGGVYRGASLHTASPRLPEGRRISRSPTAPEPRSGGRRRYAGDRRLPEATVGGHTQGQRKATVYDKDSMTDLSPAEKRVLKSAIEHQTQERAMRRTDRRKK